MIYLLLLTGLIMPKTQAAFAPVDTAALVAAVGTCEYGREPSCTGGCLGETPDGSCPLFAASNDATGNPYGVIGVWDVSAVTSMQSSKCTRSPFLWPRLPLWCF